MSVALNTKHLSSFISEEEYAAIYPQVEAAHKQLEAKNGPGSDFLGWMTLPREGTAALTAQASLPQQLEAPVEKGQTVGTVQVYHGETLLGEYEVKAAADALRMDFGTAFSLLWGSLTG